jgi:hypothetical protein
MSNNNKKNKKKKKKKTKKNKKKNTWKNLLYANMKKMSKNVEVVTYYRESSLSPGSVFIEIAIRDHNF